MITLTPLPPLPVQTVLPLPALPAPNTVVRFDARDLPVLHTGEAATRKPARHIFIEGEEMTDLYPMRVQPCADRPGFYHVEFDKAESERIWWDGKGWPALLGRFDAKGWRGKPQP